MSAMLQLTREKRFLQPGQLAISSEPLQVTTILGSCVAVCLWDATRRLGGMNHFMLPMAGGTGTAASPRFGDVAMRELIDGLRAIGARLPFLRARVFGGAAMFPTPSRTHLGEQNAELALSFLSRAGIEVVEVNTGGSHGRKLTFTTDEGAACLISI